MIALPILIGFGAGLATTLLLASVLTGTAFAFPLFLVSPLPVAIVTFGWGAAAGLTATVVVGVLIAAVGSLSLGGAAVVLAPAPAAMIATLARSSLRDPAGGPSRWPSFGRLLATAAALAAAAAPLGIGLLIGFDPEAAAALLASQMQAWLASPEAGVSLSVAEIDAIARLNVALLPYSAAAFALIMLVFNVWLGGRVTAMSGLLTPPWRPLWTTQLSPWVAGVFLAALAISLVDTPLATLAAAVAGAFGLAEGLVGLAVLHALTRGLPARPAIIGVIYVLLVTLRPAILVVLLLGIADGFLRFRTRLRINP